MGAYRIMGLSLSWLLRIFILLLGALVFYAGDTVGMILFLMAFIVTLLPVMLEQMYNMEFHWIFEFLIAFLVAAHMFGAFGAYAWFPLYDDILHMVGSSIVAFIGFTIIFSLNYAGKIRVGMGAIGVFTFLWGMAIGAVWEIMEFIWDNLVVFMAGSIVQDTYEFGFAQTSLFDTMTDLSLDGAFAVIVAILCVHIVRRIKKNEIYGIFHPFVRMIQHRKAKEPVATRKN